MQTPLVKIINIPKLVLIVMVISLMSGCSKFDFFHKKDPKPAEESADVVYDWYKLIAQIQLRSNPSPVLQNYRNFGFVGVGLYEAVQPGIKGAVSLSTKLYQMPAMPAPEPNNDYLWGASANAFFPSLFKQILAGLTNADIARMYSLEN